MLLHHSAQRCLLTTKEAYGLSFLSKKPCYSSDRDLKETEERNACKANKSDHEPEHVEDHHAGKGHKSSKEERPRAGKKDPVRDPSIAFPSNVQADSQQDHDDRELSRKLQGPEPWPKTKEPRPKASHAVPKPGVGLLKNRDSPAGKVLTKHASLLSGDLVARVDCVILSLTPFLSDYLSYHSKPSKKEGYHGSLYR